MIIILNNKKIIFIHIPKTAGTSILSSLFNDTNYCVKGHKIAKEYSYLQWLDSFCFSVVRNPYDRFVSHWLYHTTNYYGNKFSKRGIDIKNKSLEEYFHICTKIMSQWQYNWYSMTQFLYHSSGKKLDHILRFETLQQDWQTLCHKLNISPPLLPKLNTTPHHDYRYYLDDKTKNLITTFYYEDFVNYDYIIE